MSDSNFEFRLERMFADAPSFPDAELFVAILLGRLDRDWVVRRMVIGLMGVLGGLIGAYEVLKTGAVGQLTVLGDRALALLDQAQAASANGFPLDMHAFIGVALLAVVAGAFGVARLIRDA